MISGLDLLPIAPSPLPFLMLDPLTISWLGKAYKKERNAPGLCRRPRKDVVFSLSKKNKGGDVVVEQDLSLKEYNGYGAIQKRWMGIIIRYLNLDKGIPFRPTAFHNMEGAAVDYC
ncbi:MAG: hypothetical protein AAF717_22200 [Bacteroidota bacterium]|nr:hypothetical protein [uncultured Allomuricauda sp.]